MSKGYKLKRTVSSGSAADLDDVWALKHALRQEGFYPEVAREITPFPDRDLFRAIKQFQRQNGLRVDGIAKPGGETEHTLQHQLHAVAKFRCVHCKAWHGGLYSPSVCTDCWGKGYR